MYIQKEIMTRYGIPATYHVLQTVHTYYGDGISHVDIAGYFSKEAFENSTEAVVVNQVEVDRTLFQEEEDIYNAVLNTVVFQGGTLCEE